MAIRCKISSSVIGLSGEGIDSLNRGSRIVFSLERKIRSPVGIQLTAVVNVLERILISCMGILSSSDDRSANWSSAK